MEMERPSTGSPRKLKTNLLCMPRLKSAGNSPTNKAGKRSPSPATALLERLREAVFRLVMLSALSSSASDNVKVQPCGPAKPYHHHDNDHRRSEAVADCIEFIKKKTGPEDEISPDSSARSSSDSGTSEVFV